MAASRFQPGQASGLPQAGAVRVVCVTSGKGGVGKSNVSVNVGLALARRRKRVALLDADLGLANVDVMLGLKPRGNLSHVVSGERTLAEIMLSGPHGLKIIPASSGVQRMAALSSAEHAGIIGAFSELGAAFDMLLVDCAAGISDSVVNFSRAAREVIVVACDEPASVTDAYALIKVLSRDHGLNHFHILANRVTSLQAGRELFDKLLAAADRFLDVKLSFLGAVPEDRQLCLAVKMQQAVMEAFPRSPSAAALRRVASQLERWPARPAASGDVQFFVEQLVQPRLQQARFGT